MKHAIMVMDNSNTKILQSTINILDDSEIDFFVYSNNYYNNLFSNKSKINFVVNRKKHFFGSDSEIGIEHILLGAVINDKNEYDYVHLISSNDIPLMDKKYFKHYFENSGNFVGFVDYIDISEYDKMKYYYFICHIDLSKKYLGWIYIKMCRIFNKIFHIRRIEKENLEEGFYQFSIHMNLAKQVYYHDNKIFKNTIFGNNFYIQTILKRLNKFKNKKNFNYYSGNLKMNLSAKMALRYVDYLRGEKLDAIRTIPYSFCIDDFDELKRLVNTNYIFCHKTYDKKLVEKLFSFKEN